MTKGEKGLCMLGLRPAATEAAQVVDAGLTAREATDAVGTVLEDWLAGALDRAHGTDPLFAREVAARVRDFVLRGGKRLRTAFAFCGWRAAGGSGDPSAVLRTGAALELLQACALIHDDVMDQSVLRRGSPAVHVDFARAHWAAGMSGRAEWFGTSAAVLAGDLALAWADDLLTETALASPHGASLHRQWQAMRGEMVAGQYRDLHAQAARSSRADEALAVATLKSALYTVARPLALGAALTGADARTLDALYAAGRCAGLAFQLRDDLLGAFGDPARTGKPAEDDLRSRKRTYLLAVGVELAEVHGDRLAAAHLRADTGTTVERMRAALERVGARQTVEAKIAELAATSLRHFEATGAEPAVRREFAALVQRATGSVVPLGGEGA